MTIAGAVAVAAIHLCAEFGLFPDNTLLGPNFTLSSFVFRDLGTPESFVNETAGEKGLQFSDTGLEVVLPAVTRSVDFRLGTFAGPVEITGRDLAGTVVVTQNVPGLNRYIDLRLVAPEIASVRLTGGGNEGILVRICLDICSN